MRSVAPLSLTCGLVSVLCVAFACAQQEAGTTPRTNPVATGGTGGDGLGGTAGSEAGGTTAGTDASGGVAGMNGGTFSAAGTFTAGSAGMAGTGGGGTGGSGTGGGGTGGTGGGGKGGNSGGGSGGATCTSNPNPTGYDFEAAFAPWHTVAFSPDVNNATLSLSTTQKNGGAQSMAVTFASQAAGSTIYVTRDDTTGLCPGDIISYWVYTPANVEIRASIYDFPTNNYQATTVATPTANTWFQISITIPAAYPTAPLHGHSIEFRPQGSALTGVAYVDDITYQ